MDGLQHLIAISFVFVLFRKVLSVGQRSNPFARSTASASSQPFERTGIRVGESDFGCLCLRPRERSPHDLFSHHRIESLEALSPLYLYGPNQVGKSILASSLAARYARAHEAAVSVVHCLGGDFARFLTAAIDSDDMERFRQRYRGCGLLVIDGIQDLATKTAATGRTHPDSQRSTGKPTPNHHHRFDPSQRHSGLRAALASRCIAGLSQAIHYPGIEARQRILSLLPSRWIFDYRAKRSNTSPGNSPIRFRFRNFKDFSSNGCIASDRNEPWLPQPNHQRSIISFSSVANRGSPISRRSRSKSRKRPTFDSVTSAARLAEARSSALDLWPCSWPAS